MAVSRSYDLAGDPSRSVYNQMSDPTRSIPVSINMAFTYTVTPANGGYGQGQAMLGIDPVSGAGYLIDLVPTTVTVSVPSAVPEPSTTQAQRGGVFCWRSGNRSGAWWADLLSASRN
jgi:hypothetical protein